MLRWSWGPLCLLSACSGGGITQGVGANDPLAGASTASASDLAGTWLREEGIETLVLGADGTVLQDTIELQLGDATFVADIPCDGERYPVTTTAGNTTIIYEWSIDPHKILLAPDGTLTIEEHEMRVYYTGSVDPIVYHIRGQGRLSSRTSMTLSWYKVEFGLTQTWEYTKAGD